MTTLSAPEAHVLARLVRAGDDGIGVAFANAASTVSVIHASALEEHGFATVATTSEGDRRAWVLRAGIDHHTATPALEETAMHVPDRPKLTPTQADALRLLVNDARCRDGLKLARGTDRNAKTITARVARKLAEHGLVVLQDAGDGWTAGEEWAVATEDGRGWIDGLSAGPDDDLPPEIDPADDLAVDQHYDDLNWLLDGPTTTTTPLDSGDMEAPDDEGAADPDGDAAPTPDPDAPAASDVPTDPATAGTAAPPENPPSDGAAPHTIPARDLWSAELRVSRNALAALKAICGCCASEDELSHIRFADGHVTATDSYVAVHVPFSLLGELYGDIGAPVHVPAATLRHALWKVAKDEVAILTITARSVAVAIESAGYSSRVAAEDIRFPDVGGLVARAAQVRPSDESTFIDASRMGQVANIVPAGTTVVSRGALAAATIHDYIDADVVVGIVMPVKTDFRQPLIGEARTVADEPLWPDDGVEERLDADVTMDALEAAEADHPQVVVTIEDGAVVMYWAGEPVLGTWATMGDAQVYADDRHGGGLLWMYGPGLNRAVADLPASEDVAS